jgi:hypothetical protein
MSDFTTPSLINWLIENLESVPDTEYVDLAEIKKKNIYKGLRFRIIQKDSKLFIC